MGGALAALGLLSACQLDNDHVFFPRPTGIYVLAGHQLFWVPEGGAPILLAQQVRRICGIENRLVLLYERSDSVSVIEVGTHRTLHHLKLAGASAITEGEKHAYLGYASGVCVYEMKGGSYELHCGGIPMPAGAAGELVYDYPYLIGVGRDSFWVVRLTLDKKGLLTTALPLPGSVEAVWTEPSGSVAGVTRIGDTLYSFSYSWVNRIFSLSNTPTSVRKKQFSPYTHKSFGTEFLGEVVLSVGGNLTPGSWDKVRDFDCDFLGGEAYILREDSIWRYNLTTGEKAFVLYSPQSHKIEIVPVYRYGSAEITTR